MRYRPMPSRSGRKRKPLTSKTIRLIDRLTRDDGSARKSKSDKDSQFCD